MRRLSRQAPLNENQRFPCQSVATHCAAAAWTLRRERRERHGVFITAL